MVNFEEENYKAIIRGLMKSGQSEIRGLNKKLAEYLSINPSLVSQILSGTKDFTEEQIVLVSEFFGFGNLETKYLLALVQFERAGSVKLKKLFADQIIQIRQQSLDLSNRAEVGIKLSDSDQAQFYSSWLYSAIHLMTTLEIAPHFRFICERFHLPQERAQQIIQFLLDRKLITEKGARFYPGPTSTHLSKESVYTCNYHRLWRQKSMQIAERLLPEEFMYSCNFSVNRSDFQKIREELVAVTQKFLKIAQDSPAEDLAQLNIDLFWLRE